MSSMPPDVRARRARVPPPQPINARVDHLSSEDEVVAAVPGMADVTLIYLLALLTQYGVDGRGRLGPEVFAEVGRRVANMDVRNLRLIEAIDRTHVPTTENSISWYRLRASVGGRLQSSSALPAPASPSPFGRVDARWDPWQADRRRSVLSPAAVQRYGSAVGPFGSAQTAARLRTGNLQPLIREEQQRFIGTYRAWDSTRPDAFRRFGPLSNIIGGPVCFDYAEALAGYLNLNAHSAWCQAFAEWDYHLRGEDGAAGQWAAHAWVNVYMFPPPALSPNVLRIIAFDPWWGMWREIMY